MRKGGFAGALALTVSADPGLRSWDGAVQDEARAGACGGFGTHGPREGPSTQGCVKAAGAPVRRTAMGLPARVLWGTRLPRGCKHASSGVRGCSRTALVLLCIRLH